MKMQSAAAFLSSSQEYLLYVDCVGNVCVWSIPSMKSVFTNVSMAPLLDQAVSDVFLRNGDQIVVRVGSGGAGGKEYIYFPEMQTWVVLSSALPGTGNLAKLPKVDELEVCRRVGFCLFFWF